MPHFSEQIDPNALPGVAGVNVQTGATYAYAFADKAKLVSHNSAANIAATLPQATREFGLGFYLLVQNVGAGMLTLTTAASLIDGVASLVLPRGAGAIVASDGVNWFTVRAPASASSTILVNPQAGATYTYAATDAGKLVTHANASPVTGTLPIAVGLFGAGFFLYIKNVGATLLTVNAVAGTVDGAASVTFASGESAIAVSNAGNWTTLKLFVPSGGGLTGFTASLNATTPNTTQNASALTPSGGTTDQDGVYSQKGVGALLAQIPDDTIVGGSKRGVKAIDWQLQRTSAASVASGNFSVIGGGSSNRASGQNSIVAGGAFNSASGNAGTVSGGFGNTATPDFVAICGGQNNLASSGSEHAFIGGGLANVISLGTHNTVSGGNANSISNGGYGVVAGGRSNLINTAKQYGTVSGGFSNTAQGVGSVVAGGIQNRADTDFSMAFGKSSITRTTGELAHCAGGFVGNGDAARRYLILCTKTNSATGVILTADGTVTVANNGLRLDRDGAIVFSGQVVARIESGGINQSAAWEIRGSAHRVAAAASSALIGVPTVTQTGVSAGAASWAVVVSVDAATDTVTISVIGEASKIIRWACSLNVTEVYT